VPDLAIVPRELFDAAQNRKAKNKGVHCSKQQAPKRLLSGLLRCAACGGGMSTKGADKTGRVRVRCTTAAESGTCPNPQTFYIDTVESRVLSALRAEMQSPAAVAEYVRTYTEECAKLAAKRDRERTPMERRLGEVRRSLDRMIDDIAFGRLDAATFGPKATEMDNERKRLEADLQAVPPQPIALHPGVLADYERKLKGTPNMDTPSATLWSASWCNTMTASRTESASRSQAALIPFWAKRLLRTA
jgi:site-specific DNA recombinase